MIYFHWLVFSVFPNILKTMNTTNPIRDSMPWIEAIVKIITCPHEFLALNHRNVQTAFDPKWANFKTEYISNIMISKLETKKIEGIKIMALINW